MGLAVAMLTGFLAWGKLIFYLLSLCNRMGWALILIIVLVIQVRFKL